MHRTPEQWSKMQPSAVLAGSEAQRLNVLSMAREDIVSLGRTLEAIQEDAEHGDMDACHELARIALTRSDPAKPLAKV